ncbi:MAG TPA: type II 3-dehydroquinate dehydratase [Bacteroidia bacterium]|nr:type II 3-dehydroquinate dehydratase [Bacteroidia bacterium]
MRILILNGPNLNLLGKREPDIYGGNSFETYLSFLKDEFPHISFDFYQSNVEGELINKLHECGFSHDGIVFNPGGYTHTSVSIGDAVAAIQAPVVEVHISKVLAREDFRHHSFVAPHCRGSISGFGLDGYRLAVLSFLAPE